MTYRRKSLSNRFKHTCCFQPPYHHKQTREKEKDGPIDSLEHFANVGPNPYQRRGCSREGYQLRTNVQGALEYEQDDGYGQHNH